MVRFIVQDVFGGYTHPEYGKIPLCQAKQLIAKALCRSGGMKVDGTGNPTA